MKIKPITSDEQWYQYLRRINPSDESLLAFMNIMMKTYPLNDWLCALPKKGRKHKRFRLMQMCWDYYDGLTPERRYECFNRHFETTWDKSHRFFQAWGH